LGLFTKLTSLTFTNEYIYGEIRDKHSRIHFWWIFWQNIFAVGSKM